MICTYVGGPTDYVGVNVERYFETSTDLAYPYAFIVSIQRKSDVVDALAHAIDCKGTCTG